MGSYDTDGQMILMQVITIPTVKKTKEEKSSPITTYSVVFILLIGALLVLKKKE